MCVCGVCGVWCVRCVWCVMCVCVLFGVCGVFEWCACVSVCDWCLVYVCECVRVRVCFGRGNFVLLTRRHWTTSAEIE